MKKPGNLVIIALASIALTGCTGSGSMGTGDGAKDGGIARSIYAKIMEARPDYTALKANRKTLAACINWAGSGENHVDLRYSYVYYEGEFSERAISTSELMQGAITGCKSAKREHDLDCDCVAVDRNGSPALPVPKSVGGGTSAAG
jgi:hypothetical protein